jgi:hypothetical protein
MYSRTQRRCVRLTAWAGLSLLVPVAIAGISPVNSGLSNPPFVASSDAAPATPTILLDEPQPVAAADAVPATQPSQKTVVINDPLPPAFWSGLIMLTLAAVFISMPRFRRLLR